MTIEYRRYPPSKLKRAFEMLVKSGKLDEVEQRLTDQGFKVLLTERDAALIVAELASADSSSLLSGSPDCPC